jgi:glycosyltransferase 2 family protein
LKKHHLGAIVGVTATLIAGYFVYYRWSTSGFVWQDFVTSFESVNWHWMSIALASVLVTYWGRALRWEIMLRPLTSNTSVWRVLVATCIGFAAVVLFGRAGEAVRPFLIAKKEGVSFSSQIAAWVVERMLDLLMVLVIFGIALTQVGNSAIQHGAKVQALLKAAGYAAGITGLVCLTLLIALRQFRGGVRDRLMQALSFLPGPLHIRIEKFLTAFEEGMASTRNSSFAWMLILYTILEWAVIAGSFYCSFHAFPATASLGLTDAVITLGFIAIGSIVQIPGVGGGMQLAAIVVLTEFYGVNLGAATSIALTLWINNFVIIIPVGFGLALREGIKWRSLKHLGESASDYSL